MEASDELLTIAELAVGLAGFSGVVVVFRGQGGLRLVDRFRFLSVLSQALTVLVLAFVPFGFRHGGVLAFIRLVAGCSLSAGLLGPGRATPEVGRSCHLVRGNTQPSPSSCESRGLAVEIRGGSFTSPH